MFGSAFCQNFDNVPPWHKLDSWCGIGATGQRAGTAAGLRGRSDESEKPLTWPREVRYATRPGAGVTSLGGNQARMKSNIQANFGGCCGRGER
jgi:hypothetical protein